MSEKGKLSFPEYFKIIKWALSLGFKYSKWHFLSQIITDILLELRSLFYAYFFAQIIDEIINLIGNEHIAIEEVLKKMVIILLFNIFFIFIRAINKNSSRKLNFLSRVYQQEYEFTKLNQLGLQTIQDPDVNKLKDTAHRWLTMVDSLNRNLTVLISNTVLFVVSGIYLFKIMPILIPLFILYAGILFVGERFYFKKDFQWQTSDKNVEGKNKNYYLSYILTQSAYLDEISVVGSFNYLSTKVKKFFSKYNKGLFKIFDKRRVFGVVLDFFDTILIFWGYIQTFVLLISGDITIGRTTFYMSTIENFDRALGNLSSAIVAIGDFITKLSKVYEFYQLEPRVKDGDVILPRLENPPSIEFKNVDFTYPNSKNKVLKNFSLNINSGEKVAIVGANGAGKSTLTKLIARLYDPNRGEILINGNNLKSLKIDDWYKNVGLLFQDFKIYDPLTVEENIYLGKTAKELDRGKIIEAAKNADADEFISKYPQEYKTYMNERYEDGIQPSKGQKQKIAIARFFYRNAPLAIFDEPTSAIDAESEYKIFNRIYSFFSNKTVIIISHRFSTVRNADRIIVLDDGQIVEEGSHKELMALDGKYANAFRLQAEGYKD